MFLKGALGIQIPNRIAEFIHGTTVAYLGTRNRDLEPSFSLCYGARVSSDRETLKVYILEPGSEQTMANLDHNGQMAVIVSQTGGHESYQLKGEFVASRPSTEADYAIQKIWLDKILPFLPPHLPERFTRVRMRPAVTIEMRIRELYEQTPGPGTGGPISCENEGA